MVRGSANTLLARVRGNMITRLTLETELGARSTKPSRVQTHDRPNANARTSPTAASTPPKPPAGRNPRARPSAMTMADASR